MDVVHLTYDLTLGRGAWSNIAARGDRETSRPRASRRVRDERCVAHGVDVRDPGQVEVDQGRSVGAHDEILDVAVTAGAQLGHRSRSSIQ